MKVIQIIPSLVVAGAETMLCSLAIRLKEMGEDVSVVSLYDGQTDISKKLSDNGIEVHFLSKKKGVDFLIVKKLRKLLNQIKPDVIHSHLYACKYAYWASKKMKGVVRIHTLHNIAERDAGGFLNVKIKKSLFKSKKVVPVSLSAEVKKSFVDFYKLDANNVPIVFNGVELERCKPLAEYKENATRIIHVGRFSEQKNHKVLIEAMVDLHTQYPNLRLDLFGEGEGLADCLSIVAQNNAQDYIRFNGVTDDVFGEMSKSDIFILPSLWEGMPLSVIEAMGTALPIVVSNVGGIGSMLSDGQNALLIEPTRESIKIALQRIIDDPQTRARLGKNARAISVVFSDRKMAEEYQAIYLGLLG